MDARARILEQATYKPGDLPPTGYLEWHEWAEVQRKAVKLVRQVREVENSAGDEQALAYD